MKQFLLFCITILLFPWLALAEPEIAKMTSQLITGKPQINSKVSSSTKPADLTITGFTVTRQGRDAHYSVTFRNIGQGIAGCFDYKIGDSAKGIRMNQVCPSQGWKLKPGEEVTRTGTVERQEMWTWPDEFGYNSKLHITVNHSGKTLEEVTSNNRSGRHLIRWGL